MSRELKIVITGDPKGAQSAMRAVGDSGDQLKTRTIAVGTAIGHALGSVAVDALKDLGRALGGALTGFDDAYDAIQIGTGATGEAMRALQGDFRAVATSGPDAFGTVSTAVTELRQGLGITGKPLQDLSRQVLDLSRITGTDLDVNVTSVTHSFQDWAVATGDQAATLDAVFRASQATNVPVSELLGTVDAFGPVLRGMGLGLSESIALVGSLEHAGVNTDMALRGFKKAVADAALEGRALTLESAIAQIEGAGSAAEQTTAVYEVFGNKAGPELADAISSGRLAVGDLLAVIEGGQGTISGTADSTADWAERLGELKNDVLVTLEPLITRVFEGIGGVVDWLSPKIEDFATAVVPAVEGALDSLAVWWDANGPGIQSSVGTVFDALRAAGGVVMDVLGEVVPFLGETVLPIIGDVAGGIGELVGWFQELPAPLRIAVMAFAALNFGLLPVIRTVTSLADNVGEKGLKGKLAGIAGFLTSPWGIALAVGGAALAIWGEHAQKVTQRADDFRTALEADSGAVGENTRALVANRLEQLGILENASHLGIATTTLVDAVLDEAGARDAVNAELERRSHLDGTNLENVRRVSDALRDETGALTNELAAYERVHGAIGSTTEETQALIVAQSQAASAAFSAAGALHTMAEGMPAVDEAITATRIGTEEYIAVQTQIAAALTNFATPVSVYDAALATKTAAERTAAEATADATSDQTDSWEDFFDDTTLGLGEYAASLAESNANHAAYAQNLVDLTARYGPEVVAEISAMGERGVELAAQMNTDMTGEADDLAVQLTEAARLGGADFNTENQTAMDTATGIFETGAGGAVQAMARELGLGVPQLAGLLGQYGAEITRGMGPDGVEGFMLTGGQRAVAALAGALGVGVDQVTGILSQYGISIADTINPVLNALGQNGIHVGHGASGGTVLLNSGGVVPGSGPDRDSVLTYLTPGEYVLNRSTVDALGVGTLHALNQGRANIQAFNAGGWVRPEDVPHPPSFAPYQGFMRAPAAGGADLMYREARDWVEANSGPFVAGLDWARAQAGKPYIWGAVGPNGYDCSGFMSALTNVLLGRSPHSRLFTSASIIDSGGGAHFRPGMDSPFTVGSVRGNPGHMAGTLLGVNVESTPSRVRVGGNARGTTWGRFSHHYAYRGLNAGGYVDPAWLNEQAPGGDGPWDLLNPHGAMSLVPMAAGGIVTSPTAILAGESGAEAVIPLDDPRATTFAGLSTDNPLQALIDLFRSTWTAIVDDGREQAPLIEGRFHTTWTSIVDDGREQISLIEDQVVELFGVMTSTIDDSDAALRDLVGVFGDTADDLGRAVTGLGQDLTRATEDVTRAAEDMLRRIAAAMADLAPATSTGGPSSGGGSSSGGSSAAAPGQPQPDPRPGPGTWERPGAVADDLPTPSSWERPGALQVQPTAGLIVRVDPGAVTINAPGSDPADVYAAVQEGFGGLAREVIRQVRAGVR
jgi:hypothetical protein